MHQYSLSLRMCEWNWEWKLRVGLHFFSIMCEFINALQGNEIKNYAFFTRPPPVKH